MMLSILNFIYNLQFANKAGLYALLSLIPLIIIYLLRPRPLKIKIPSLMFLMEIEKKKRLKVFRKFLKDPLFFLQLLVLLLLSFALASPFIMAEQEGKGNTVIVLDASASMQADEKFKKAVAQANNFLSSRNTIILAESIPVMVVKQVKAKSASDAIKKLKAKATSADLASAMLLGKRMLPEGGRIVVISDFANWKGENPLVAKKIAEAGGVSVRFVTIKGSTDNIAIVNGWFEGDDYKILIKNFNKIKQEVNLEVFTNNKKVLSTSLNLNAGESKYFVISNLQPGITRISISGGKDALLVDNNAYVIIPKSVKQNILYIGNPKSPSFLALKLVANVKQTETSLPSFSEYSFVIVNSKLSSDDIKRLSDYVREGGNAVIVASPDMKDMALLPVKLLGVSNQTSLNVVLPTRITQGIRVEKIKVTRHFKAKLKRGAESIIEGGDNSPMLAYWRYGKGMVIYSGFADPKGNIYDPLNENVWNDFFTLPEYPLFWKQLLEWISGSYDISEYNARTGTIIKLPKPETVKTPGDEVITDVLLLDEVGVYELEDKQIAVNLFDEQESNLKAKNITSASDEKAIHYGSEVIRVPRYLDIYLIIFAMFFVFLELYYLRWRGEL